MKTRFFLLIILFYPLANFGQIPVDTWRDHFSYNEGIAATSSSSRVFVAVSNGVFWYNPTEDIIGKLSKVNGLSDIGISTIQYSPYQEVLMIGYQNGNIDVVFPERVVNLPFILEKPMQGSKRINHFYFDENQTVYVSTGFGIVVLNLEKFEVTDTYFIGDGGSELWVNQTAKFNNRIYAATTQGLLSASLSDPLIFHFQSWRLEQGLPNSTTEVGFVVGFDNHLVASQSTGETLHDFVWYFDGSEWIELTSFHTQVLSIHSSNQKMVVCSRMGIGIYQSLQKSASYLHSYTGFEKFNPNHAVFDSDGNLAVADGLYGLQFRRGLEWNQICPEGPSNNRVFHISPYNDDIIVAGGARTDAWGNRWFPLTVHTFAAQQWSSVSYPEYFDAIRVLPNRFNTNEFFVASWGNGVALFRNGELFEMYGPENSSLASIISGPFCRIGGMVQDNGGNLWVTNGAVANPISVRMADGTWVGFPYQSQISADRLSDITLSPSGNLWIIIPSGGGLFVLNPGENIASTNDDEYLKVKLTDSNGNLLPNEIYSMVFDREGYMWVGTNEGVLISYNPERVFDSNAFYAQRIKIPDVVDEFAVYLLDKELITSIAVDGGNRKWFGTSRSGLYLQSSDGTKQIKHFTTENSPLPSNTIQHVAIHPKTGEVFIATDKGLVSYRGDATEPLDVFGKVYAFPNPVRPDYDGVITITGLVNNTNVKITDVAGNLVYETRSQGGQATWDGKDKHGRRVATGVYLFFCADSSGEQSAVGKLLFVK